MRRLATYGCVLGLLALPARAEETTAANPRWHRCQGKHAPDAPPFAKRVALTFDDGPSLAVTPEVVRILRKHDVPATFFMVGHRLRNKKARALAAEIAADPLFAVANHSYSHPALAKLGAREAAREIDRTTALLERATGAQPRFFRFPYSAASCTTTGLVRERGYRVAGWHVDSADWCYSAGKGRCRASMWSDVPDRLRRDMRELVLERVRANDGGIVLLHDTYQRTADELEALIEGLRDAGYELVALDDAAVFPLLNR